jgi:hypothetical protein
MRKISNQEQIAKEFLFGVLDNFTASPLTENKVAMDILRIKYTFQPL